MTNHLPKEIIESHFFDLSPDLLAVSKEGTFIHLNKSWEKILGWSREELQSKEVRHFLHPDDYESTYKIIVSPDVTDSILIENRYRCKNGEYKWLAWTAFKKEGLIYGIARDVTERKKKEIEMREALIDLEKTNKDLDKFAYIVSHDLKAPLRGIKVLAKWIVEDKEGSFARAAEYASMIIGRSSLMDDMISGILEYSKIGRKEIAKETVDIRELLEGLCSTLVISPKVRIHIEMNSIFIHGSKTLFSQIFSNLISNAIKYNDKFECIISITGKEERGMYTFEVADNGPGIAREAHQVVFEIFKTLASDTNGESTGVGLSIVKKIVEDQLKGKIRLESEEGKGAKFIIKWSKDDCPGPGSSLN
jgi:PAS domain S-box-containing protein